MRTLLTPIGLVLALAASAPAAAPEEAGFEFFEKKVRPVLAEHCYKCHSTQGKKQKGGLAVDSREAIRRGGDTAPAVVPGKPEQSLLIQAVRYTGEELRMPPKGKLPDAVIDDLEKWVQMGAPDPRDTHDKAEQKGVDASEGRKFWAFQPPRAWAVPNVKDDTWPRCDIDRFILSRLEGKGLSPIADAGKATLIRRAYFDLIGLPPTPEQIEAFVNDPAADAFARLIDSLLATPQFGERWGRHWLDVARFAESSGGGRSMLFPEAWRYRDYVIESFNSDKPYNRFIAEQIAGDLLPYSSPEQRRQQLVATAFLALGPTNYESQDKTILEMDVVDEQLDTMGKVFLGMTIGCARCHDHKFDPIPTKDYYALAGILRSTKTLIHDNVSRWVEQPLPINPEQEAVVQKHEAAAAALKETIRLAKEAGKKPDKASTGAVDVKKLEGELKKLTENGPPRPMAMSVMDTDKIEDCHLCIRGNVHNPGAKVPRGFLLAASPGQTLVLPAKESGRRQLAEWLSNAENPLTARVVVNRIWHHLVGSGLVRTVDNFGSTGETPSHPELLDYLALRFVQDGWSVKRLVREIMLSRTYQLGSAALPGSSHPALAEKVDPENRLLWRMNRRRLDAEAIRDAMLAVSEQLDLSVGSANIKQGTSSEYGYQFDDTRRSVYTPVFRNRLLELFEAFDFADPNLVLGRRNVSTVPTQALYLMNNPFVMEQARHAAREALAVPDLDDARRVDRAYRTALGRGPTARERELALNVVAGVGQQSSGEQRLAAWAQLYQALFACIDFRYLN